jgi:hypothetical protein
MGAATRCALLLALVVLVAAARTAVGDGGAGNGGGGGQATEEEQVLRLWSSAAARGREAEDEDRFFKWEWEDDEDEDVVDEDEDDDDEDHVMAVQGRGACRNVVNVDSFGAAGDGDADDTQVRAYRPIISAFRFHTVALHHACMRTVNIIFIWSVTLHSNTLLPKRFHHLLGF